MINRKLVVCSLAAVVLILILAAPYSVAHRGFTLESLQGRWGFNEESIVAGTPGFATGIFRFDGKGGCTVVFAESGGGSPSPIDFEEPRACDYTIDSDGKGTITGGVAAIRFVLAQHRNLIRYALCCERGFTGRGEMNRM